MRTVFFWVIMQQEVVLHNNPEECRSHLLHSRSLKWCLICNMLS